MIVRFLREWKASYLSMREDRMHSEEVMLMSSGREERGARESVEMRRKEGEVCREESRSLRARGGVDLDGYLKIIIGRGG